MQKENSIIIIDGSNFYYKLKDLKIPHLSSFNYNKFVIWLTKKTVLKAKYYCIGKIHAKQNDKKARLMMAKQQSFVTNLQKQNFIIQFGYLLKSNDKYHEKGVDVQIATNLLKGAYRNLYKKAFLVTSDSDLLPAILESQSARKIIVYVGFAHQPSFALMRSCKKNILLTREDLLQFVSK